MSTDNLLLTEHAIKRHAKRLQKQMKNYNQDLSLGESQNLLSKILGFNDWNHLNTILKPAIENYEKELNTLKSKAKAQDEFYQKLPKSFTVNNLEADSEFFTDEYINGLATEPYNNQEDFIDLRNNIINYNIQNKKLNKLNLEFAQILSTFSGYIIRDKYIENDNFSLHDKRKKVINNILDFVIKNEKNLDFNVKSKEGLNLLSIILIYTSYFEEHHIIEEEFRNEILNLIELSIPKTDLNQFFVLFSHFIVLFFDNFFTRNNSNIINGFLKNIKQIPDGFIPYFLIGNCKNVPNLNLLKILLTKTNNEESNKYIGSAINGLIYKPEYFKYNKTDYSHARSILKFLIDKKYFYDINKIQEAIIYRLNIKNNIDNFEITDNIKFIIDYIPGLMTSDFKEQLKNTIKKDDDYSKYFIKTLKLNK